MTLSRIFAEKAKADRQRPVFDAMVRKIAAGCDCTVPPITDIKTLKSIFKKNYICGESPTDILRGRVFVDTVEAFVRAKVLLANNRHILKLKDNFFTDKPEKCGMPYLLAKLALEGSPCEIQVVYSGAPELYAESHKLYKRAQFREAITEMTGVPLPVSGLNARRSAIHAEIRETIPTRSLRAVA